MSRTTTKTAKKGEGNGGREERRGNWTAGGEGGLTVYSVQKDGGRGSGSTQTA